MKKIFVLFFLLIATIGAAQNGISYQAVLLNPNGEQLPGADNSKIPLVNSSICLRFSIAASLGGTPEYQETITTRTDPFGMVNVTIGTGNPTPGSPSFSTISWGSGPKNLKVELDLTGLCTSFITVSDQPFTSVPFALYALNSGSGGGSSTTTLTGDVSGTGTGTVATSIANNAVTTTKIADSNVTNAKLQNSSITINGSIIPLGGTATIAVTADAGTLTGNTLASNVVNSSLTSVGTLNNLSVTNPIAGSITGNASTATKLVASKNINGVAFDGSTDITVTADAGTLTGNTLASNVVNSSLTSVGILNNLSVTNPIAGSITGNASTATKLVASKNINGVAFDGSTDITVTADAGTLTGNTLASNVVNSSLTSVGTLNNLSVVGSSTFASANITNDITVGGKINLKEIVDSTPISDRIKTSGTITYPLQIDSMSGKFKFPSLSSNITINNINVKSSSIILCTISNNNTSNGNDYFLQSVDAFDGYFTVRLSQIIPISLDINFLVIN